MELELESESESNISDEKIIETPFEDPYVNQFIRPNNTILAGIVGMPNSGKTSLFNLLTGEAAPTDSNLFCTVGRFNDTFFLFRIASSLRSMFVWTDPYVGYLDVSDSRQAFIQEAFEADSVIGSSLGVVDTAGIVDGSHKVDSALSVIHLQ